MRKLRNCQLCGLPVIGCLQCDGNIYNYKNFFCSIECFQTYTKLAEDANARGVENGKENIDTVRLSQ